MKPFVAVVAVKDRLSVVGSSELLAQVLPKHSPSSILPADWDSRGTGLTVEEAFIRSLSWGPEAL